MHCLFVFSLRLLLQMIHGKEEPMYMSSSISSGGYTNQYPPVAPQNGGVPALELKVPMCCDKCEEKVKEELEELNGVRSVICDRINQRVTIVGFVDPLQALKQVKKAKVDGKCELISSGSYIVNGSSGTQPHHVPTYDPSQEYGRGGSSGAGLIRSNSYGRELGRLPSFGNSTIREPLRQDFMRTADDVERRNDYYGDVNRDSQGDSYGVRRMPSFNRHRYHDAEYLSMDRRYGSPYGGEPVYSSQPSHRPVYQSQVSFSKLPVTNPDYMKHIASEY
jgi:copper chaperone CopZ